MQKVFVFILLFGHITTTNAQFMCSDSTLSAYNMDSLNNAYGKNKRFLKKYELASLIALSYFPEVGRESIQFKFNDINSTARTTITFFSLFRKVNKRYIIYINDDIKKTGMLLCQAPFDAQVAVIGHELAHVADFKNRNFSGMINWSANYLFEKGIDEIEKNTDKMVVEHGLGQQLYKWADFVLNHSTPDRHYLKIRKKRYLLPNEIKKYISNTQ